MNSQKTSYNTKRQATIRKIEEMESLLITMYHQHLEEVLSTTEIKCKIIDSTGIETTRSRRYGEDFDDEDMHQELNLDFTIGDKLIVFRLFNGNCGCGENCDSKMHCHTWITHGDNELEFFHGFKRGDYGFEGGEAEEDELEAFTIEIDKKFGTHAPLVQACMYLISENLEELHF